MANLNEENPKEYDAILKELVKEVLACNDMEAQSGTIKITDEEMWLVVKDAILSIDPDKLTAEEADAILESMKVQKERIWVDLDESQQEGLNSDILNENVENDSSEVDMLQQIQDPAGEHEPADSCNMGTVMSSLYKKCQKSKSDNQRIIIEEKDQRITVLLNLPKESKMKESELKHQKNESEKMLESLEKNNTKLKDELKSVRNELTAVKSSTSSMTTARSQRENSTETTLTTASRQGNHPLTHQNSTLATQSETEKRVQSVNTIPDKVWQSSMSNTKREYRLSKKIDFEMFFDYLSSELRMYDLLYVLDDKVQPYNERNDTALK